MRRRRLIFLGLAATIGVLTVGVVGCRRHRHDPEKMQKFATWAVDDVLDDIDATPEQREDTQDSKDRLIQRFRAHREESKAMRQELLLEWDKDKPDAARVHELVDDKAQKMRAFAHEFVDEVLALHARLRPEQRAKLREIAQEHMDRH